MQTEMNERMMVDYKKIVEKCVEDEIESSYTTIEYNNKWYSIEIIVKPVEDKK